MNRCLVVLELIYANFAENEKNGKGVTTAEIPHMVSYCRHILGVRKESIISFNSLITATTLSTSRGVSGARPQGLIPLISLSLNIKSSTCDQLCLLRRTK